MGTWSKRLGGGRTLVKVTQLVKPKPVLTFTHGVSLCGSPGEPQAPLLLHLLSARVIRLPKIFKE